MRKRLETAGQSCRRGRERSPGAGSVLGRHPLQGPVEPAVIAVWEAPDSLRSHLYARSGEDWRRRLGRGRRQGDEKARPSRQPDRCCRASTPICSFGCGPHDGVAHLGRLNSKLEGRDEGCHSLGRRDRVSDRAAGWRNHTFRGPALRRLPRAVATELPGSPTALLWRGYARAARCPVLRPRPATPHLPSSRARGLDGRT